MHPTTKCRGEQNEKVNLVRGFLFSRWAESVATVEILVHSQKVITEKVPLHGLLSIISPCTVHHHSNTTWKSSEDALINSHDQPQPPPKDREATLR